MTKNANIPSYLTQQSLSFDKSLLLQDIERNVPGSVKYAIKRYRKLPTWNSEDTGAMIYHFNPKKPAENHLELRFCVSGNF